jgi:hypothetical protein
LPPIEGFGASPARFEENPLPSEFNLSEAEEPALRSFSEGGRVAVEFFVDFSFLFRYFT